MSIANNPNSATNNTITQDLAAIQLPYARTVNVLRMHALLSYDYYPINQPTAKCHICDNTATMRYVRADDANANANITTQLCDRCRCIRLNATSKNSTINTVINEINILHAALPTLRNAAAATFERMLYRYQIMKFNDHDTERPCVLCHCASARIHTCSSGTVLVCNDCKIRAHDNIAIRVHKMYLGSQVIAIMQQHDIYTSVVRLYLALLWNMPHTC